MRQTLRFEDALAAAASAPILNASVAPGFGTRIRAVGEQAGAVAGLLHAAGTDCLRVEMTDTNSPDAIELMARRSSQITLIQPMHRKFLRFKPRFTRCRRSDAWDWPANSARRSCLRTDDATRSTAGRRADEPSDLTRLLGLTNPD